jgi:hypothetical protein
METHIKYIALYFMYLLVYHFGCVIIFMNNMNNLNESMKMILSKIRNRIL